MDIDRQLLDMLSAFDNFVTAATRRSSMSAIDKQRIAAIRKLEQLGYTFAGDDWIHSANDAVAIAPTVTDELHAMLVKRANDLEDCAAECASWQPLSVQSGLTKQSAGPQARSLTARANLKQVAVRDGSVDVKLVA